MNLKTVVDISVGKGYIMVMRLQYAVLLHRKGGGRGATHRNPLHSGNSTERKIGNSGNFSDCSPESLTHSGRNVTAPLILKSSYAYDCRSDKQRKLLYWTNQRICLQKIISQSDASILT